MNINNLFHSLETNYITVWRKKNEFENRRINAILTVKLFLQNKFYLRANVIFFFQLKSTTIPIYAYWIWLTKIIQCSEDNFLLCLQIKAPTIVYHKNTLVL